MQVPGSFQDISTQMCYEYVGCLHEKEIGCLINSDITSENNVLSTKICYRLAFFQRIIPDTKNESNIIYNMHLVFETEMNSENIIFYGLLWLQD